MSTSEQVLHLGGVNSANPLYHGVCVSASVTPPALKGIDVLEQRPHHDIAAEESRNNALHLRREKTRDCGMDRWP